MWYAPSSELSDPLTTRLTTRLTTHLTHCHFGSSIRFVLRD